MARALAGLAFLVWIGLVLPNAAVLAQPSPARVAAVVQADSVKVGEPFTISLVAEHNFSTEVRFPSPEAGPLVFGDLEVLSRGDVSDRYLGSAAPGQRVDSVAYRVATFALDSARVPALPVEVIVGSDTVLVSTQQQIVPVTSTVGPEAEGLKGLAPLASFPQPVWPWALLGIAILTALAGLVYWWRQDAEPPAPTEPLEPDPSVSAFEQAMDRLDRLPAPTGADLDVEAFYVGLSAAVRAYLSDRLNVPAREQTTAEIVATLRDQDRVSAAARKRIRAVLEVADLVKFADSRPSPSDNETALREARAALHTIEETVRPEAPPETETGS
jgi:hypothetical protein